MEGGKAVISALHPIVQCWVELVHSPARVLPHLPRLQMQTLPFLLALPPPQLAALRFYISNGLISQPPGGAGGAVALPVTPAPAPNWNPPTLIYEAITCNVMKSPSDRDLCRWNKSEL